MEGAEAGVVLGAGFAELEVVADDADDVGLLLDELGEVIGHAKLALLQRMGAQWRGCRTWVEAWRFFSILWGRIVVARSHEFEFSPSFGEVDAAAAVRSLIDKVGFEPDNAAGEVRRSFDGSVGPLYQIAYLMGALQFRALHKELVDSKKMTHREYADAVLHENSMPIEMLRAGLERQKLTSG